MARTSWRCDDELLERVRRAAAASGWSMNKWMTHVLSAATAPGSASEADRVRARMEAADLLEMRSAVSRRPDPAEVARARRAAGHGTPLADLVIADRR
jgi:hypothetical protein